MANKAAFTINGTPSADSNGDRIYVAALSETLDCALEANPSAVLSARFQLYDPTDGESPLASKDAPLLTWNENGAAAILLGAPPYGVNDTVTVNMPAAAVPPAITPVYSYIIRCTVSTPSGPEVFERLVAIPSASTTPAIRKTVPGESTQARARGYSDQLNDMADAIHSGGGGGGGIVGIEPTWANMYWDDTTMVFDGSDALTAWPAVNGDMDDLAPQSIGSVAAPRIGTSGDSVYMGGQFCGRAQGFRLDYGCQINPLTTSIPVDEDLYCAFYAHIFNLTNGTAIRLTNNFSLSRSGGNLNIAWNAASGNHNVLFAPASFSDAWLRPGLWEVIHRVGDSWELWFDGRRYVHSNQHAGNRFAVGTNFGLGSGGGSYVQGHYQGVILHYGTLPSREERFGGQMWLAGDR